MIGRCDGWTGPPLVLHFADDHHAFHEDAKPGDLTRQLGIALKIEIINTVPTDNGG